MKETSFFFKKFLAKRKEVGSILPSSNALVRKITNAIPFNEINTIVELGGGTGAITHALVKNKKRKTKLLVFEPDDQFFLLLKKKFSGDKNTTILKEKAENLDAILKKLNLQSPECIVCSLPFISLGREKTAKILREVKKMHESREPIYFFSVHPAHAPKFFLPNETKGRLQTMHSGD